jgi:hypothetical protein
MHDAGEEVLRITHKGLVEHGLRTEFSQSQEVAQLLAMQIIWGYYVAAVQRVGIAKEDLKQLWAEYGVNLIAYSRPRTWVDCFQREERVQNRANEDTSRDDCVEDQGYHFSGFHRRTGLDT